MARAFHASSVTKKVVAGTNTGAATSANLNSKAYPISECTSVADCGVRDSHFFIDAAFCGHSNEPLIRNTISYILSMCECLRLQSTTPTMPW
jgi:hypothetical protein